MVALTTVATPVEGRTALFPEDERPLLKATLLLPCRSSIDEPREATRDGGPDRGVEALAGVGAGATFGTVAINLSVQTHLRNAHNYSRKRTSASLKLVT